VLKLSQKINFQEISSGILEKISALKTPANIIAVIKIPQWPVLNYNMP